MKRSFGYLVPIQEEFHIVEAENIVYHARAQSRHGISQRCRVHPKVYQVSEDIHCSDARDKFHFHGHESLTKLPVSLNEQGASRSCCHLQHLFTLLLFSIANDTAVRIAKFHRADETDFVPVH